LFVVATTDSLSLFFAAKAFVSKIESKCHLKCPNAGQALQHENQQELPLSLSEKLVENLVKI
jgi:hypothetical protein